MKTKLLFTFLSSILLSNSFAQTTCFTTPDGIETVWSGGWSYKDYVIPSSFKIDSVYMDATRPGHPVDAEDFIFAYCAGTTTFNAGTAVGPFSYSAVTTSLYNKWIDLTSFNYSSVGVVEVLLPVNSGAIWNNLCFAISPISTVGIQNYTYNFVSGIYPNPANSSTTLMFYSKESRSISLELFDVLGNLVSKRNYQIISGENTIEIDLSDINSGIYFLKSDVTILKFQVIK